MGVNNRINILAKPYWTNSDIMLYVGCATTKASKIRQACIGKKGAINKLLPRMVSRDAVLNVLDTSYYEEITKLRLLTEVENGGGKNDN